MGSSVKKVVSVLIPGSSLIMKSKNKAAPKAKAPQAAGVSPAAAAAAKAKEAAAAKGKTAAERAREARRGLLGRGAEDREQNLSARDQLGARADSLGVPSSAQIQDNRRFKRQGVKGASRRLLSE